MTLRCREALDYPNGPYINTWAFEIEAHFPANFTVIEIRLWKIGQKDSVLLAMKLETGFHEPRNVGGS